MNDNEFNELTKYNLNRLLDEKNISGAKLALLAGVGTSHISRLRSGKANIGNITLERLSKALGVDKQEFFKPYEAPLNEAEIYRNHRNAMFEAKHHRLILEFVDKEWGVDTNRLLLEIERLDPAQRAVIKNLLKVFAETLREAQIDC